jgi:predicted  nucleic acid-binding Zn-ribbon protein
MSEPSDLLTVRMVEALEASSRTNVEVLGQVKGLEREVIALRDTSSRDQQSLKETFDRQMGDLEDEMRTMNSHLDNLVRETVTTNQLLREDMDDRKRAQEHRLQIETEEREWRRKIEERRLSRKEEIEDDNRSMAKKVGEETWAIAKQPLGYLIAGIIFWVVITYFKAPSQVPLYVPPPAPEAANP